MTKSMKRTLFFGLSLTAMLAACGDDKDATPTDSDEPYADSSAPANYTQAVTLNFAGQIGDDDLDCTSTATVGTSTHAAALADARMYVSEVSLKAAGGDWVEVHLDADGTWQRAQVALLDFESKQGRCADSGSTDTNQKITGLVPAGDYEAVRFTIGVPVALNHLDASTSPAPFNAEGLYWTWMTGYKFLRVDWMVETGNTTDAGVKEYSRWNIHLGSTGCTNAEGSRTSPPDEACVYSNRPVIELTNFNPASDTIVFDAGQLVKDSNLHYNMPETAPGCMSGATDTDCGEVFNALGLDLSTGSASSSHTQTVFSVKSGS